MFTLITQVWDTKRRRYVEDELTLWESLPSFQREALISLQEAFPGSEWVEVPEEAQEGSESTQAVA